MFGGLCLPLRAPVPRPPDGKTNAAVCYFNCLTPSQPDTPATNATIDIKGAGNVSALDIYEGGRTQLTESGTDAQVSNILGGVTAKIKTQTSYTVVLSAPASGKEWKVTASPAADVTLGGLTDGVVGANNQFTFKATKTGAVITVEQVTSGTPTPGGEQPISNAWAAIDGGADNAATGAVKVVWQKVNSRAVGSGTDGKPTADEAIQVIRYHLTEELGYKIKTENLAASAGRAATFECTTQIGVPVGTYTFTYASGIVEGARYTDTTKGYEIALVDTDGTAKISVANTKYAVYSVNNGTPTWVTTAGDGTKKEISVSTTDTVKVTEYDALLKVDGAWLGVNKTYSNSGSNTMPSVKDLVDNRLITKSGTGVAKTTSGATAYVAYTDTSALVDKDELANGYVDLTDSATDNLTFASTTAGSGKTFAKLGEEITVSGLSANAPVRVTKGASAVKVKDFVAPATGNTTFTIAAADVTDDITVSDLVANTLTKAIANGVSGMSATWYVNGEEVDFGTDATKVVNLASTDKLSVKVTFANKIDKVAGATAGAKLTVKAGGSAVSTAKWTGVQLGEATVAPGVIEFEKANDIAANTNVTAEGLTQTTAGTLTVEYTVSTTKSQP